MKPIFKDFLFCLAISTFTAAIPAAGASTLLAMTGVMEDDQALPWIFLGLAIPLFIFTYARVTRSPREGGRSKADDATVAKETKQPAPQEDGEMTRQTQAATLGGGCFWCLEAIYQQVKGVSGVVSGYAGGNVENPDYKSVCTGATGHAEVVQITFDPSVITYAELLHIFWRVHDPTTLNRQGGDVGSQYRSIILCHDDEQQRAAEHSKAEVDASDLWRDPVVTEIAPLQKFHEAEAYHHNYYRNNPRQPYCFMVIDPKVDKFRKSFQHMMS